MTVHYQLAGRTSFPSLTGELAWKNCGGIEGVKIWARDEATGEYVRVLESAPAEYVDGEAQAYEAGNFETVETAKHFGSMAYRYINKGRGR